jgi:gliding motility-associated-like protein
MNQRLWRYIQILFINGGLFFSSGSFAQCPPNIGFESGNFAEWECSIGKISNTDGSISLSVSGPVDDRHTIIANNSSNAQILDPYGNFPINCPNGSNYSVRLGNSSTGAQAEQLSYTFTIPANQNNYSIIYNYAVVFQNPKDHEAYQQPKFTANVYDVTTGNYIGCSSFSYTASSNLPGFHLSSFGQDVYYKSWTPVTIKLSGYAGKTIRIEFTTNDCSKGGHFGYAYVDVNEDCASPISGNVNCQNDTMQVLTAPYGFASYRWFNSDFSQVLATNISIIFKPVPPPNTVYAVEVTPFPDQGCTDTVYTTIIASGGVIDLELPQKGLLGCVTSGIDLTSSLVTTGSSPDLKFSYFTDSTLATYASSARFITTSGTYYIKATNVAGCTASKGINLKIYPLPVFSVNTPQTVVRPNSIDLKTTISGPDLSGYTFSYWEDDAATISLPNPQAVTLAGTYYIKTANDGGCSVIKPVTIVVIDPPIVVPNAFSPNGDGVNDVWQIPLLNSYYPGCVVEVFSRAGQKLFHSQGYVTPWDGKYNGNYLPLATYYYVIRLSAGIAPLGGSITIVR